MKSCGYVRRIRIPIHKEALNGRILESPWHNLRISSCISRVQQAIVRCNFLSPTPRATGSYGKLAGRRNVCKNFLQSMQIKIAYFRIGLRREKR